MLDRLDNAAASMLLAVIFGVIIGTERQARGRMAGVRTNALVALGAASFVIFSGLFPAENSPTRVAAQIVSGVGFLGAGLIFRDGYSVHGLNTAATLWCSAAVGMLCGAGAYPIATMLAAVVMFINLGLRPVVQWLDRRLVSGETAQGEYRLELAVRHRAEAELRQKLVAALAGNGLAPSAIETRTKGEDEETAIAATIWGGAGDTPKALDRTVAVLAGEPGLIRAGWSSPDSPSG